MGISDAVTTLLAEFPYALYGSVLVGVLCAVLGVYVVARRVVFFGAVLTQVSLVGLALSFVPPLDVLGHTGGALSLTALVALLLSGLFSDRKIPRDAVLGVVFVSAIALRMLILQKAQQVEVSEVENLMRGDILFITPGLFLFTLLLSVAAMAFMLLLARPFAFMGLDPETGRGPGVPDAPLGTGVLSPDGARGCSGDASRRRPVRVRVPRHTPCRRASAGEARSGDHPRCRPAGRLLPSRRVGDRVRPGCSRDSCDRCRCRGGSPCRLGSP